MRCIIPDDLTFQRHFHCYMEILQTVFCNELYTTQTAWAARAMGPPAYEAQLLTHTVKSDSYNSGVYLPPTAISEEPRKARYFKLKLKVSEYAVWRLLH